MMPDFRAFLCNLSMRGDSWTEDRVGNWRNRMSLRLGRVRCELVQHPDFVRTPKHAEKGSFAHTTDLIIRGVPRDRLPFARGVAGDLAALLSFASLSGVWAFGENYPAGTKSESVSVCRGQWNYFRPTIDTLHAPTLRTFLENAWSPYRRLKRSHNLPEIFDYLVIAEQPDTVIELQLAIAFLVLESLKFSHAKSVGIPRAGGRFRKVGPGTRNPKRAPAWTFEELLDLMFRAQGMRRGYKLVIRARNELIHSGVVRKSGRARFRYYERSHGLIREYLLRLLHYKGTFLSYEGGYREL